MKIWGNASKIWGLYEKLGISNDYLGVSSEKLGLFNEKVVMADHYPQCLVAISKKPPITPKSRLL